MATGIRKGSVKPGSVDQDKAERASRRVNDYLARHTHEDELAIHIEGGADEALVLPRQAVEMFAFVLDSMARGFGVQIMPVHAELTTQQAADMLNVSRPYLIGLLDEGKIPCRRVGRHRRVLFNDLVEYQKKDDVSRRAAVDELARLSQELGED
ncbi:helix-turn-helix domain-containing protein [Phytomonospora sp. NPDC050363]|uniref:helix-turn-helix domain-containing protein n=1 Tax=Phytomonospora sp. NPDC050363 TaxID=3155642 RepID=UPI0033FBE7B7